MTIELRSALRRARLENGRIMAVNLNNQRNIWIYSGVFRLIGHFSDLALDEFTEATRWWVNLRLEGPSELRSRQKQADSAPVTPLH